jgi:uncharacterized membrane protein SirB2
MDVEADVKSKPKLSESEAKGVEFLLLLISSAVLPFWMSWLTASLIGVTAAIIFTFLLAPRLTNKRVPRTFINYLGIVMIFVIILMLDYFGVYR